MKNVLILGGSGFLGRHIKEYIVKNNSMYEIDSPSSKELDLINEEEVTKYLKNKYYDIILHCAVHNPVNNKNRDKNKSLDYSLKMFFNFEKNQHLFGKMIYFGSGAEFDKRRDLRKVNEEKFGDSIPVDEYGFAKYIINKSIINSDNIYNLRLFGIYGKYENWTCKFISNICCKAIKGIPLTIRQNVFFDYLYIDDFLKILDYFLENTPKYKDYNICTGKGVDLKTYAEIVRKISNKNLPIYIGKEGLAKEYTGNNSRLISEIGDFNYVSEEEAIKKLYTWYEENQEKIELLPLLYQ